MIYNYSFTDDNTNTDIRNEINNDEFNNDYNSEVKSFDVVHFSEFDRYEGDKKDGIRHGQGTMYFDN